jgi:thiol-disulfide isomerase/thioredoxin
MCFSASAMSEKPVTFPLAPHFSLDGLSFNKNTKTHHKTTIDLNDFKGHIVYLDFWASWCGPCRKSFPWMNEMQEKYTNKGFKVIAINVDDSRISATEFLKTHPANFSVAFDTDNKIMTSYKAMGMPVSYLIDRKGKVIHVEAGFNTQRIQKYEQYIIDVLSK